VNMEKSSLIFLRNFIKDVWQYFDEDEIRELEIVLRVIYKRQRWNTFRKWIPRRVKKLIRFFLEYKRFAANEDCLMVLLSEKRWALDFLSYVLEKNPEVPFEYFPESDHREIEKFVRNKLFLALFDRIKLDLVFDEEDFAKQRVYEGFLERFPIQKKAGCYEFAGFKSSVDWFELGVFVEKYGVGLLKSKKKLAGSTIIDCGAFSGDTAHIFDVELSPQGIICIEPDEDIIPILLKNIRLNNMEKVTLVKKAVGEKECSFLPMRLMGTGRSYISKEGGSQSGHVIEVTTIDNLVEQMKLDDVGLLKMDIEGFELPAIKGALETIKRFAPTLLIAVYHKGQDFFEIPRLIKEINPYYQLRFLNLYSSSPSCERIVLAEVVS